jgi:hypothetical protein
MTSADDPSKPEAALADHAGSVLCRLLVCHPDVVDIEILGQSEMFEGTISYSLGVMLPGGRELFIEVEDAPAPPPARAGGKQPGRKQTAHAIATTETASSGPVRPRGDGR